MPSAGRPSIRVERLPKASRIVDVVAIDIPISGDRVQPVFLVVDKAWLD